MFHGDVQCLVPRGRLSRQDSHGRGQVDNEVRTKRSRMRLYQRRGPINSEVVPDHPMRIWEKTWRGILDSAVEIIYEWVMRAFFQTKSQILLRNLKLRIGIVPKFTRWEQDAYVSLYFDILCLFLTSFAFTIPSY